MVTWLPRNAIPSGGGYVYGFGRLTRTGQPTIAATFGPAYLLASPGTVDVNATTRKQAAGTHYIDTSQPFFIISASITAAAGFAYTQADVDANPGKYLTATMFIAPASAFASGAVPTPAQIIGQSIFAIRALKFDFTAKMSVTQYRTTPGNIDGTYAYSAPNGQPQVLPPNTKYWVLVAPTAVADKNSAPSSANDIPVGDVNTIGRAMSVWTNRTPKAPTITAPSGSVVTFAGSTIELAFKPNDPDAIASYSGDVDKWAFDDVAGVQVQYAPRQSAENPDPVWTDLPIADTTASTMGKGWYLDDEFWHTTSPTDGAKAFWQTYRLKIVCGASSPVQPSAARLPEGDWQIRVRTFDYGHDFPGEGGGDAPPMAGQAGEFTINNYPATNTSPWSAPLRVFITDQVPKPLPLSPVGNIAIIDGQSPALVWQYRNTHAPPFAQGHRTVQVKKAGDANWTTVVDDNYALTTVSIGEDTPSGYALVSGNQYLWRVKVADTTGTESAWSDPASFWVVPAPGSGEIVPVPGESVDGAALGCGTHRVFIYRRGGLQRVGEIKNLTSVEWGRVRDDISTAKIVVSGWDIDCGTLLASLHTWAYELVIFRDNGFTTDRVWEGPLTLLTFENDKVTLHAKDVMAYAYRRIIKQAMSDAGNSPTAGSTVVDRATRVLLNAFAPDDPNVLGYMQSLVRDDDAKQYRSTPAYSRTAFEEVDDMAANSGLDYTAIGRAILLWGTKHRIGTLPEFTDKDLGASPIVSEYGMSMANRYAVSDGNGVWGEATRLDADGKDPLYGLVEMLSSTWASDAESDTGTYTQEGLNTVRESFAQAAERSIASRYPSPLVVRIPDNTRLNPDTVVSIQHLVPGVVVPLRSTGTLREVVATQKLDKVNVVEVAGEETITITLSPFSRDDNDMGTGGEEE